MPSLSANRLRELLDYDPDTGLFTRRVSRRGRRAALGDVAGAVRSRGSRQICIDGKLYLAARLAVLWMTGDWPIKLVDHINCNPADDRWVNLRSANHSQNGANARSRTSLKGVTFDRRRNKYAARIKVNYRTINLGRFDNEVAAHAAYADAAKRYFGEYARSQ